MVEPRSKVLRQPDRSGAEDVTDAYMAGRREAPNRLLDALGVQHTFYEEALDARLVIVRSDLKWLENGGRKGPVKRS